MKTKFYHTSGTLFKPGDVIGGPGRVVCITTRPVPHYTIQNVVKSGFKSYVEYNAISTKKWQQHWDNVEEWITGGRVGDRPEYKEPKALKNIKINVYEVKPFNKPMWVGINDEFRVNNDFVEIVRIVGNAKGILQNHYKRFGETEKSYHYSKAFRRKK